MSKHSDDCAGRSGEQDHGKHTPGSWRIDDAQLRKERLDADLICRRHRRRFSRYTVILDHESEPALWTIWKSPYSGRWYGTNDCDDRVIEAPTLKVAKMDLRLCNFPPMNGIDREAILKSEGRS